MSLADWRARRVVALSILWVCILIGWGVVRGIVYGRQIAGNAANTYIIVHTPGGGWLLGGPPLVLLATWWWLRRSRGGNRS